MKMIKVTQSYCDNCGDLCYDKLMYWYEQVPWNIESANAGESAGLCEVCNTTLSQITQVGETE